MGVDGVPDEDPEDGADVPEPADYPDPLLAGPDRLAAAAKWLVRLIREATPEEKAHAATLGLELAWFLRLPDLAALARSVRG